MAYRIKVIAGPGVGSELELDDGDSTIGRAPENTLVINDGNVSRVHARFRSNGNRIAVMDAGSRNGVYVNDRKLDAEEQQPLGPGDRVVIGQSIIELFAENAGQRPRTGAVPGARAPAPRPNGNGNGGNMTGTGAVSSGIPSSRAPVPVGKPGAGTGRAPVPAGARPGTAAVPRGPQQRPGPGTGGSPKVVGKKDSEGLPKPLLFGLVGLVVVVAFGAILISGARSTAKPGGGTGPSTTATPLIIPQIPNVATLPGSEDKCSPRCQNRLDVGDSLRDSNNLKAARDAFQEAVDIEPTCLSCAVRLEAVERSIEEAIRKYEKAGVLYFEKGDFQRSIDSWKIGVELMPDPTKMKDATKKAQTESRRRELKKKIDEASKLIERQPQ